MLSVVSYCGCEWTDMMDADRFTGGLLYQYIGGVEYNCAIPVIKNMKSKDNGNE